MKYIKTFEAKQEFKIGDTVVFKFKRGVGRYDIKVGTIKEKGKYPFDNWWTITDLDNRKYSDLSIPNTQIIKKATQKSIDKYMLEPISNKFNI